MKRVIDICKCYLLILRTRRWLNNYRGQYSHYKLMAIKVAHSSAVMTFNLVKYKWMRPITNNIEV